MIFAVTRKRWKKTSKECYDFVLVSVIKYAPKLIIILPGVNCCDSAHLFGTTCDR